MTSLSGARPTPVPAGPAVPDLDTLRARIGVRLDALCGTGEPLHEAMRYALVAPGKRVRPLLVLLIAGEGRQALDAACAVEMVHAASLMLDDLPCMDDARLRRGRATAHLRHGEASTILGAVALIARAFEVIARLDIDADSRAELSAALSNAIGAEGMAAGQDRDVAGQASTLEEVETVNRLKTAVLFTAAARMGGILSALDTDARAHVEAFATEFGMAFQIADDALDLAPDPARTGKDVGADAGKPTILATGGAVAARELRGRHLDAADRALAQAGIDPAALSSFLRPFRDALT
ncbi:polyprenyl synthetase family protein [Roseobacter sp. HKCCA0434]|uniref:polyprenyl synthetase family protein n=1 Tax=Roseobacter sp. HKCCA0434 TaxID=3079297 RepID=UPI0029059FE6|nr:polyprenyl synthetase family protein [Roseobacter sp. HKCCA0434]